MKLSLVLATLLSARLLYASPTEIVPLPTPTTTVANQSRTTLKHRNRPLLYSAIPATVPNIIALNQQLPAGVKTASVKAPRETADGRHYFLPIDSQLITSVTLGLRVSDQLKTEVIRSLRTSNLEHVDLFEINRNIDADMLERMLVGRAKEKGSDLNSESVREQAI